MDFPYDVSRSVSEGYKVWIAAGGLGLALLWTWFPKRVAAWALVALTVVSTLNYGRWGPYLVTEHVDTYDLIHYYLNAKYFDELGYYDLYPAAVLADYEDGGFHFKKQGNKYMAQDPHGHFFADIPHALEEGRRVQAESFTPERWDAFAHDLTYMQTELRGMNDKLWRQMLQDHGYNGTPVWTVLAQPFANAVPVESIKLLCYLDLGILLAATAVVGWAYGGSAALWAWFFLMISYSVRWPTITWAFLRYDWVAALMVAMSLLKKGRPLLAGAVTGYAATLRLFPAMWMYGPFMKGVAGLTRMTVHKKLLVLAAGFLLAVAALEGLATAKLGAEPTRVHFENMLDHNSADQLSSRRIGLALALPFRGETLPKFIEPERKSKVAEQKPLRYGIAAVMMLLMGWGLRRSDDDEAFAMGFIPFFLLTTASYYYYVARITLVMLHAGDLSRWRNRLGLAWLVGLELFCNYAETRLPGHRVYLVGYLSWGLSVYTIGMTAWLLWDGRKAAKAERAG